MYKLAITTRPIEKGISGSGMHLDRLLAAFVRLNRQFELHFLRTSDRKLWLDEEGEAIRISRNPAVAAWQLRRRSFDIVHYSPLSVLSPMLVRTRFRCATLHPDDELIIPEHYSLPRRLHSRHAVAFLARKMDRIFTVSQTSHELVTRIYGLCPERVVLTPNAVDQGFRPLPMDQLEETHLHYAGGRPFVLHISNFSARKNPWTLLKAFARVAETPAASEAMLVVVGNGWKNNPAVDAFLGKANLRERVRLTGFVPKEDVPRLLNLAQAFVFPSLSEGFGMPNLEAMACGCPVITSDAFAIPEVVGDAAWILRDKLDDRELADVIVTLLNSEADRRRLTERGLARAQQFSWDESATRLLRTYQALCAG